MREIVSLQLGQLSNYTATHFWNAQESYFTYSSLDKSPVDHDVHWRAGRGSDGSETFLPRTVIYDLKGGFGSMRKINALYEPEPDQGMDALWPGPSVVHKQPAIDQSAYQASLDSGTAPGKLTTSSVRYWSDFSRVYFHPRSLVQLYDFELNSTIMPFERFSMGNELFGSLDKEHDIVDRDFRPFVEECDRMQGVQVFSTVDDAWGGFAASYLEALRDEYPKSCIWTWGLQSPMLDIPRDKRQLRLVNTAQSISRIHASSSMLVPLSVPEEGSGAAAAGLRADFRSVWHVSALLGTAIETATLPSRLAVSKDVQAVSLDSMAEYLNTTGTQNIARMRMAVGNKIQLPSEDDAGDDGISLFHVGNINQAEDQRLRSRIYGQVSSTRSSQPLTTTTAHEDAQGEEGVVGKDRESRPAIGSTLVRQYEETLRFPLLDSYPRIYANVPEQDEAMDMQTTMTTDKSISAHMKALKAQTAWSVKVDEREDLSNELADIANAYQEDWSSGSDEDDDDL